MSIGYAGVSTEDHNLDLQRDALSAAGCERILEESSGVRDDRPSLAEALSHLRRGDSHFIWRLDRPETGRYVLPDLIADTGSGHNITAELRPVGEFDFANGSRRWPHREPMGRRESAPAHWVAGPPHAVGPAPLFRN